MIEQLITSIRAAIDLTPTEVDSIKLLFKEKKIKKGEFFLAEG